MGIKTIVIIVLIYFGIKLFQRVFIVRGAVKEMKQRMRDYAENGGYEDPRSRAEGEIRIKSRGKKSGKTYEAGEYVDYEEIE